MEKTKRAEQIIETLEKAYRDAPKTYLDSRNPFEMTIATILSAHTTDRCVNSVTPKLFHLYPDPASLSKATQEAVAAIIRPCGTYNRKAQYVRETARAIVERFAGDVPRTMEQLVTLSGVSRKTANVVLSVAYGVNEGIVVDTHVMRVTTRLALSNQKTPEKVETDLMAFIPHRSWGEYSRLIGAHGRTTCSARAPGCASCVIGRLCPSAGKI